MYTFKAKLDRQARRVTLLVFIVTLVPSLVLISLFVESHEWAMLIAPATVLIALGVTSLFRPKHYTLDAENLRIVSPSGDVKYPLRRFRTIDSITREELGPGTRTFASGGFLGYFGEFRYKKYGPVTLYVTNADKMFLITLDGNKRIIICPADRAAFMAAFQELISRKA